MSTNRFFFLIAAAAISGVLCAWSAMADVSPGYDSGAYKNLTAVELRSAKQPRLEHGMNDLQIHEAAYREHLPMQLSGPAAKIKKAKYKPSSK